jgi:hypothetical protein
MMKRLIVLLALGTALFAPGAARSEAICTAAGAGYPSIAADTPGVSAAGVNVASNGIRLTPPVSVATPVVCAPMP